MGRASGEPMFFKSQYLQGFTILRMINESLYKTDSHQAHQMMKVDPHVFQDVNFPKIQLSA